MKAYLREESVWRQGRVPETIDLRNLKHERTALGQLQEGLRGRVGKLCLTVEVNPSSNLLIGDLGNFQALNAIYAEYFGDHKPARTTVQVAGLPKGAELEIDLIAVL